MPDQSSRLIGVHGPYALLPKRRNCVHTPRVLCRGFLLLLVRGPPSIPASTACQPPRTHSIWPTTHGTPSVPMNLIGSRSPGPRSEVPPSAPTRRLAGLGLQLVETAL